MEIPEPIGPKRILDGVQPRQIFRGFLWDTALTTVSSLVFANYLLSEGLIGSTDEQVDAVFASAYFNLVYLPIGFSCTVVGAFIAARRCPGHELTNGIAVAFAGLVLGFLGFLVPASAYPPLWITILGLFLLFPAGALGGAIAARQQPAG